MKRFMIMLFLIWCMACSDFLEPKSQSEYVPKDASALNEMLLGEAYVQANDQAEILNILLLLDDDVTCTDSLGELDRETEASSISFIQSLYSWQPDCFALRDNLNSTGMYQTAWEVLYEYILGANAALDYIDDVAGTDEEKNNVKAQAFALRAFYYFQLVNLWGAPYNFDRTALGVPLKLTSALENMELPRNTVEEVYAQIVEDLDNAEKLYNALPEEMQFKRNYRTSLPMVQLLQSRVYLYMEEWEKAVEKAQEVIDNPNFSLQDLNDVQRLDEMSPYYNFVSMECPESIWLFGNIESYINLADLVMYISDPKDEDASLLETNFFNVSPDLLVRYAEDDLRKESYILRSLYEDVWGERHVGGYIPYGKFRVNDDFEPVNSSYFAHAFRLSEAYLNLAEAAAMCGEEERALVVLNTLRSNRFVTGCDYEVLGLTGNALVDKIREERRLELCFEGHRWFDLRRYGMPSIVHEWKENGEVTRRYMLEEKDPFYTLPIPQDVMSKNRRLVQNPLSEERL